MHSSGLQIHIRTPHDWKCALADDDPDSALEPPGLSAVSKPDGALGVLDLSYVADHFLVLLREDDRRSHQRRRAFGRSMTIFRPSSSSSVSVTSQQSSANVRKLTMTYMVSGPSA